MRVLLCTPDFPPKTGGIQLLLRRLFEHSGHHVRVVTVETRPARSKLEHQVIRTAPVRDHRAEMLALNVETLRQARAWRPQAIISGHIVASPAALIAQAHLDVPVLQYLYSDEMRARHGLARFAVRRAAASVAISAHTRTQALALGANPDRLHLIPPGVDLPHVKPTDRATETPSQPTIVTVSRMEETYKGFDVMLRAMPLVRERVPGVRWVAIGDGSLREPLRGTAADWGLGEACLFPGRLPDAERDTWLARSQVFALPSRITSDRGGGEGFGIVYLEAGAQFLPCVAGAGSGSAEAVEHGVTGLVVDPYDHVEVAEALANLLSDPHRAVEMGRAGRRRAEEHSWRRMAISVDAVLESISRGMP